MMNTITFKLSYCSFLCQYPQQKLLLVTACLETVTPGETCCLGCGEVGHLLEQCDHNYHWNHILDQYVAIPHGKLEVSYYHSSCNSDVYPELRKSGKSSA